MRMSGAPTQLWAPAPSEKVAGFAAVQVDRVGVGEARWVAIGFEDAEYDAAVFADEGAVDVGVGGGAAEDGGCQAGVAQKLFNGGGGKRGVSVQERPLRRMFNESEPGAAQQSRHGVCEGNEAGVAEKRGPCVEAAAEGGLRGLRSSAECGIVRVGRGCGDGLSAGAKMFSFAGISFGDVCGRGETERVPRSRRAGRLWRRMGGWRRVAMRWARGTCARRSDARGQARPVFRRAWPCGSRSLAGHRLLWLARPP